MTQVLLTSKSPIKESVVSDFYKSVYKNIKTENIPGLKEQPYGKSELFYRSSFECAEHRSKIARDEHDLSKIDYVISIENGIIQLNDDPLTYVDIADVIIYSVKDNMTYSTLNMPLSEMIKVPVPIEPGKTLEETYDIEETTVGEQIAVKFKFFKEDLKTYDNSNWMKHFGIDRHYQIKVSMQYVFDSMKCNISNQIKEHVILTNDFPAAGVIFQDYQNVFGNIKLKKQIASYYCRNIITNQNIIVAGPELRGYMGTHIATLLGVNHTMIRKSHNNKVKMGGSIVIQEVEKKEYNNANEFFYCLESTFKGKDVIIFDDLLATGGSIDACCKLVKKCGGNVSKLLFLADVPKCRDEAKITLSKYGTNFYNRAVDVLFDSECLDK